jgi:hypothetical protein
MQYMIEARELTNEYTHRPSFDAASHEVVVDAGDADEAISRYVQQDHSELISLTRAGRGRESIATVKKNDSIYLVRVYAA